VKNKPIKPVVLKSKEQRTLYSSFLKLTSKRYRKQGVLETNCGAVLFHSLLDFCRREMVAGLLDPLPSTSNGGVH
jgi:hypothetical protein